MRSISSTIPETIDTDFLTKKKKQVSVQLPSLTSPVSTVRFCDLNFGRLQPSDDELDPHNRFEFGNFVARQALLHEEYWTAAWLRAEEWASRTDKLYDTKYGLIGSTDCVIYTPSLATITFVLPFLTTHQAESALILVRHGESLWNEKNLFSGCCSVPLTNRGVEEAIEAGQRISYIPIDMIFTSALIRAQMTALLAMTRHSQKKVPIIIHDESEQATTWTQVYSEKTTKQSIPVITAWQLNERMYGELQGLNKQETAERYGKEKVHEWCRSFDIPLPKGESLEVCFQRAVPYFKDFIEPQLKSGKHVMVASHGNSLRSIIMYRD
ncbi:2,3-bisphosphoglycerate-dependent phosphoglycerate mutase [Glycine max]|nr:2,3-bisphosphoglycerate-dependent phosphoglycerate mutase [Glycine max]KAH1237164.1 2,3-bisphosphoglycerate-dependent phosphoglycerate mutase [Glycine max]